MLTASVFDELFSTQVEDVPEFKVVQWAEHRVDPRLARLSYSSLLSFNGCERKYQLTKLNATGKIAEDWRSELTFSFGHMVGEGVQRILMGHKLNNIIIDSFAKWKEDLYAENEKQKKTFFHAMFAIEQFMVMHDNGFLEDYELAYYNGIPAAELSFRIEFPNEYYYRGFVDIVLRNKVTGQFAIFEIKTDSGMYINPGKYQNSAQGTGYSSVLQKIEPDATEFTVYYLVYMTRKEEWECFEFHKTMAMRAQWILDTIHDIERIQSLVETRGNNGIWPIRGNHCMNFMKECPYLSICTFDTDKQVKPLTEDQLEDPAEYQFEFDWKEFLNA